MRLQNFSGILWYNLITKSKSETDLVLFNMKEGACHLEDFAIPQSKNKRKRTDEKHLCLRAYEDVEYEDDGYTTCSR